MTAIKTREDIAHLVDLFYQRVRKDEMLGPVFNKIIPNTKWPMHLEKLTDFWETNLLGNARYKGNPTVKHIHVDAQMGHQINSLHFHRWLILWFETLDSLYDCVLASRAKAGARRMATAQFMAIGKFRSGQAAV